MTTNPKHLIEEIAAWKETQTSHEIAYNTAVTYDDRGSRDFAEEMIRYSQERIDELENELTNIKKGA